jgi:hypothetical protein
MKMSNFMSTSKQRICLFFVLITVSLSSCTNQLKISTGARDYEPLIFNNEYYVQDLEPIEVEGAAFWGVPSFSKNNKNKRNTGFLFTFNGVEIGRTKRILPMLTLMSMSLYGGRLISELSGKQVKTAYGRKFTYSDDPKIKIWHGALLTLPVAGTINNLIWKNAAFSGASQTLNFRLVDENPRIDVFFYPKYDISKTQYLWRQKAIVKARVSGAILKRN